MATQVLKMIKQYLLIFIVSILLSAYVNHDVITPQHSMRADFRFGHVFYSLCSNERGEAFSIKGRATAYDSVFSVISSDTSALFHLDSVNILFKRLNDLRRKPMILDRHMDAPRVEIYYDNKKIYDSHRWDSTFWDI